MLQVTAAPREPSHAGRETLLSYPVEPARFASVSTSCLQMRNRARVVMFLIIRRASLKAAVLLQLTGCALSPSIHTSLHRLCLRNVSELR